MSAPTYAPTVVIENFYPCLEGGRYPVKRIVGEVLEVWVDVFKDGHDVMSAVAVHIIKAAIVVTKKHLDDRPSLPHPTS